MTVTITHVYEDYDSAQDVIEDLEESGFTHDQISVVGRKTDGTKADDVSDGAATGATLGTVAGGAAGLLAGLGLIAIPGIGPLVAAGVLATTLTGAAAGAVGGGLLGALVDYGLSEDQAHVYAESVRRGGTLVSVRVDESRSQQAETIMRRHGPIDMEQRGRMYRDEGWSKYDASAPSYTPAEMDAERERYTRTLR